MDKIMLYGRFNPLKRVICYDIFDRGFNGWMVLLPNFTEHPDFDVPPTKVNKDQWPPEPDVTRNGWKYENPGLTVQEVME